MRRRALLTAAWAVRAAGASADCRPPDPEPQPAQREAWHLTERLHLLATGERLQLRTAEGKLLRNWPCADLAGRQRAPAEDLRAHPARRSFVVALPGLGELWEIQLAPDAPPIHDGLVHDHRMHEAIASPGQFGIRRSPLGRGQVPCPLLMPPDQPWSAGPVAQGQIALVNLDIRREIARWPAQGLPRWDGERLWVHAPDGRWLTVRPPSRVASYCAG